MKEKARLTPGFFFPGTTSASLHFLRYGEDEANRQKALVRRGDPEQQRARPERGRVPLEKSRADRRVAETIGRAKQAPEDEPLSIRPFELTFYINRAGKNLPAERRRTLQRAKTELRSQFGKD